MATSIVRIFHETEQPLICARKLQKTIGSPSQSKNTLRPLQLHSTRPTQNQHHQSPAATTTSPLTAASRRTQRPPPHKADNTVTMALAATATPCRRLRLAVRVRPFSRTARRPCPDPHRLLPLPRRAATPHCCPCSGPSIRTVRFAPPSKHLQSSFYDVSTQNGWLTSPSSSFALLADTGQLSEKELSAALVNGDWTAFDPHTVRMMIRMFDSDRSGSIGFEEFCGLWSFLASWRTLFDRFDTDRSGTIQRDEFQNALVAFRYRLSDGFVDLLFRTYDKRNEGVLSFDLFVQACISLKRMTDVFKKYDDDRDGYITLSFEDFLTEILKQLK